LPVEVPVEVEALGDSSFFPALAFFGFSAAFSAFLALASASAASRFERLFAA